MVRHYYRQHSAEILVNPPFNVRFKHPAQRPNSRLSSFYGVYPPGAAHARRHRNSKPAQSDCT